MEPEPRGKSLPDHAGRVVPVQKWVTPLGVTLIFSFPLFRLCVVHVLLIDFARAAHSFLIERLSNRGEGVPHYTARACLSLCVEFDPVRWRVRQIQSRT
jgi:hypothetical protein